MLELPDGKAVGFRFSCECFGETTKFSHFLVSKSPRPLSMFRASVQRPSSCLEHVLEVMEGFRLFTSAEPANFPRNDEPRDHQEGEGGAANRLPNPPDRTWASGAHDFRLLGPPPQNTPLPSPDHKVRG